jgi:hypothetical protein
MIRLSCSEIQRLTVSALLKGTSLGAALKGDLIQR